MKHYISLGAGVQSSTMALMAAVGEITPMPDGAIFADTQAEPAAVYTWLTWLVGQLPFPVFQPTHGDLAADNLYLTRSKKSGKLYSRSLIPAFVRKEDGSKGILPRKCTRDYKIDVILQETRRQLGLRAVRAGSPVLATSWIGISLDEEQRRKESRVPWVVNRWPLLELGMTRADCLEWMAAKGYPVPPRSACIFCPYHSDLEWVRLRDDEPEEFAKAVAWERAYQAVVRDHDEVTEGVPFLHETLIPLDQVLFSRVAKATDPFTRECEGMCGV